MTSSVGEAMTFPQMLNLNCVVQREPDVIAAEADRDLVMVSIANGLYYGVSDIAREIWETIERPKKISDLIDHLAGTYNVERTTCERETLSFLEDLRTEGLLKVGDGSVS
jgi:Coenzyme PQQ synthesis protein D (PqqD)